MVEPYGFEFDPDEFPHGLRCMDCSREILEGDRYASRLTGMTMLADEPCPFLEIICLECALAATSNI